MNWFGWSHQTARCAVRSSLVVVVLVAVLAAGRGNVTLAAGPTIGDGSTDGSDIFAPNVVTITAGDSVSFTWVDGTHDARDAESGAIYLPLSTGPTSKTTAFPTAGTYYFYWSVHAKPGDATDANIASNAKQVGKIIVLPAPAPSATPPPSTPPPAEATPPSAAPPAATTPGAAAATATPAPATPAAAASPSGTVPPSAAAPATAAPKKAPFEAAISVSAEPGAPSAGTGLSEEAHNDPAPRWLEAIAVFAVIAALVLTITVRTMRRP